MERLTNANHKEIGFCAYNGTQNPFEVPLTIGELAEYPNADFSPRKILVEVFDRLAACENTGLEPEEVLTAKESAEVACALNLLKEYQSVGSVEHFREFSQAEKDGRLVVLPPNDPLTLSELREMDGEPVWIVHTDYTPFGKEYWGIVRDGFSGLPTCFVTTRHGDIQLLYREYGKTWLTYRRKPEKGEERQWQKYC